MKQQLVKRSLSGFPIGIAIGYTITLLVSLGVGDGAYYPVSSYLSAALGSELGAVALQALLCGLMGSGFAMASVIWETEWSLIKQSGLYFAVTCLLVLPTAYVAGWMERSLRGFLQYLTVFLLTFACCWLSQYLVWRRKIKKINENLQNRDN